MTTPYNAGQVITAAALNDLVSRFGNVQGITVGVVSITPVANQVTGVTVSGLTTPGSNFAGFATANSASAAVTNTSVSDVTGTSMTVNILRTNTTTTFVYWIHIGFA